MAAASLPVKTSRFAPSTEVNSPDRALTSFNVAAAFKHALKASGLTQDEAAGYMRMDAGLLSRQLAEIERRGVHAKEHLWLDKMLGLPPQFWQQFIPHLQAHLAGSDDDADALALASLFEAMATFSTRLHRLQLGRVKPRPLTLGLEE